MRMLLGLVLISWLAGAPAAAADVRPSLDEGYRHMYGFEFQSAERAFGEWRAIHPQDPLGPVSQAANVLFSELERLGVLQAQFFIDNSKLASQARPKPDAALRARFDASLREAEALARAQLARDGSDRDALFAMALISGLQADYLALIEGRNLASLSYTRDGSAWAKKLLKIAPDYSDAYLAIGISDYIVGSIPAPMRWMLRIAGFWGDKEQGLSQLKRTAERGRLLAPLARIVLGIAYLREGDRLRARDVLASLSRDFPSNPLFAREVRRLEFGTQ